MDIKSNFHQKFKLKIVDLWDKNQRKPVSSKNIKKKHSTINVSRAVCPRGTFERKNVLSNVAVKSVTCSFQVYLSALIIIINASDVMDLESRYVCLSKSLSL